MTNVDTRSLTNSADNIGIFGVTNNDADNNSTAVNFLISSNRVLSNSLLINVGATTTLDGYAVTGTSNGYAFALQEYGRAVSATFIIADSQVLSVEGLT